MLTILAHVVQVHDCVPYVMPVHCFVCSEVRSDPWLKFADGHCYSETTKIYYLTLHKILAADIQNVFGKF